jgi:hypothetical protein
MKNELWVGFVGGLFAIVGIVSIARKRFAFEFGRNGWGKNFFHPKPMIVFVLTEARAVFFGFASLVAGLALIAVSWQVHSTQNDQGGKDSVLVIALIALPAIVLLVFLFALFVEFLARLQSRAKQKGE